MATPPKLRIVRSEDYSDSEEWFKRFLRPLNDFIGAVTAALSRGLTRSENFRSTVKTLDFSSAAAGTTTITVSHDLGQRPTDVWLGRLEPKGAALSAVWSMYWEYGSGTDVKLHFHGLPASAGFKARLILE